MTCKKISVSQYIPLINTCQIILAGTALTALLVYTKTVVMPFVIALFISMVCNTAATWMKEKWGLPHVLGLIFTVLLFLTFILLSALFVGSSVENFIRGADAYSQKLSYTVDWLLAKTAHFGMHIDTNAINQYIDKIPVFNLVRTMGSNLFSFFTTTSLVSLFVIFLFMGAAKEKTALTNNIEKQISYYLIVKILVSLIAGILVWIVLASIKTELALMLAFLTFFLNFIPNIGPFIATALPLPVLFLQYGFDWHIFLALFLLTAVHFIVGNILETKWLGKGMDLSPVVVIASLIFWALVWGVMGALLAVPLTSILKMLLEQSEPTKPLAAMLTGKMPFK